MEGAGRRRRRSRPRRSPRSASVRQSVPRRRNTRRMNPTQSSAPRVPVPHRRHLEHHVVGEQRCASTGEVGPLERGDVAVDHGPLLSAAVRRRHRDRRRSRRGGPGPAAARCSRPRASCRGSSATSAAGTSSTSRRIRRGPLPRAGAVAGRRRTPAAAAPLDTADARRVGRAAAGATAPRSPGTNAASGSSNGPNAGRQGRRRPALERGQARVGRDPVQPGPQGGTLGS